MGVEMAQATEETIAHAGSDGCFSKQEVYRQANGKHPAIGEEDDCK